MDKNISQSDRFGIRTENIWFVSTKKVPNYACSGKWCAKETLTDFRGTE
jgi:hypothetical protein